MLQEEYLDEGKGRAAREAIKRGGKHGKKLLDKLKGKGGAAKKGAEKAGSGAAKVLGRAGLAGGVGAGTALLGKGVLDIAKGAAGELAKKAKKIWDGGENDVDSDGAPGDHQGLPKSS